MASVRRKLLPEPKVKELIKGWCESRSAFHWAPPANGLGVHGIPDRIACVPATVTPEMVDRRVGLFIGLEAKGEHRREEKDGGASPQQVLRLTEINAASGIGILIYNATDLARLDAWLNILGVDHV